MNFNTFFQLSTEIVSEFYPEHSMIFQIEGENITKQIFDDTLPSNTEKDANYINGFGIPVAQVIEWLTVLKMIKEMYEYLKNDTSIEDTLTKELIKIGLNKKKAEDIAKKCKEKLSK